MGRRCGVAGVAEAVRLADAIGAAPGLELRGLQAYAGSVQHVRAPQERVDAIERARATVEPVRDALGVQHVTGAGTGTYPLEVASGCLDRDPARLLRADGRRLRGQPAAAAVPPGAVRAGRG